MFAEHIAGVSVASGLGGALQAAMVTIKDGSASVHNQLHDAQKRVHMLSGQCSDMQAQLEEAQRVRLFSGNVRDIGQGCGRSSNMLGWFRLTELPTLSMGHSLRHPDQPEG